MRCPKCHYLGFEPEPRCRNCGYDLTLAEDDLVIRRSAEPESVTRPDLDDLELRPRTLSAERPRSAPDGTPGRGSRRDAVEARAAVEEPSESASLAPPSDAAGVAQPSDRQPLDFARPSNGRAPRRAPSTTTEMPLFVKSVADGTDADAGPTGPERPARPPLGVRRRAKTPRRPTPAAISRETLEPIEQDLLEDFRRLEARVATEARRQSEAALLARREDDLAGAGRRMGAAAIDALLMGSISAAVFGATLRVCNLDFGQVDSLPILPFALFLLIVALGYLLMFTIAGGQTVGKMLMGIRVVAAAPDESSGVRLTARQAVLRALLVVPSVLTLGVGFVPTMIGRHRAVHDRLSHTRVVLV